MQRNIAYVRVSGDKQSEENQVHEIGEYCKRLGIVISSTISLTMSSRRSSEDRGINDLIHQLFANDKLIVSELSRLGRSIPELVVNTQEIIDNGVELHLIKQNLVLRQNDTTSKLIVANWAIMAEIERDLISMRTREALKAKKAQGIKLGNPQNATPEGREKGLNNSRKIRVNKSLLYAKKVYPFILEARENGHQSLRAIANYLNSISIPTPRQKKWTENAVRLALKKVDSANSLND